MTRTGRRAEGREGYPQDMRSLADQSTEELGGPWSILSRQKRDHQRLDQLLHELEVAARNRQPALLLRINRLVFPHAFAEESVLWPELRRLLPDGEALTVQVEQEHQQVNDLVTGLEDGRLPEAERGPLLERLVQVLREDVRDEEDELLPRLQDAVGSRRLRQLGVAWEAVRRTAPTRPHPVVSRRPPGNALAALPLTVLDRGRDRLDDAARRWASVAPVATATSHTLANVAGWVEQLPALRRGEDASTSRA
jgi:Hemerythrin HHE cation binding domain